MPGDLKEDCQSEQGQLEGPHRLSFSTHNYPQPHTPTPSPPPQSPNDINRSSFQTHSPLLIPSSTLEPNSLVSAPKMTNGSGSSNNTLTHYREENGDMRRQVGQLQNQIEALTEQFCVWVQMNPTPQCPPPSPPPPPPPPPPHGINPLYHLPQQPRLPFKLDFPVFENGDPTSWVNRADQLLDNQGIPLLQKVRVAALHLSGDALQWYKWYIRRMERDVEWGECAIWPIEYMDFAEALTKLKQGPILQDYIQQFEKLSSFVDGLFKEFLVSCFISGLSEDLRFDVRAK